MLLISKTSHFSLRALGASARSAGKAYKDAVPWKQSSPLPEAAGGLTVQECIPEAFEGCDIIFSGLDSSVAGEIGRLRIKKTMLATDARNRKGLF